MSSGEGFGEVFTVHLLTHTCKKPQQPSILLWVFECNEFTLHLQSAHFFCPSPSVTRELRNVAQDWIRDTTAQWETCTSVVFQRKLVTRSMDSVWGDFRGGGLPLLLTVLAGLEIHFHSCSWCLVPEEMDDLALVPNSPVPFCTQLSPVLILRAASAGFTLSSVFCCVQNQRASNPKGLCDCPHTHQCREMEQNLILRSLGQGSYLKKMLFVC